MVNDSIISEPRTATRLAFGSVVLGPVVIVAVVELCGRRGRAPGVALAPGD